MKRETRAIIYTLDTIVAVESSAILVAGCFGGLAAWQKVFVWLMASVAIWYMTINIERMILKGWKNEKKGQGATGEGAVQGTPWYTMRFRGNGTAHRHSGRYAEKV